MKEPKKRTEKIRPSNTKDILWQYEYDVYSEAGEAVYETTGEQPKVKVGKGFVPHGGIILKNIYNGGFRMAYDIGVIGIYVFPGPKAIANGFKKPKFLILGPPDFVQVDSQTYLPLDPATTADPFSNIGKIDDIGYNMSTYNDHRTSEVKASFRSNYQLFGKGSGYLFVDQKFIFTRYDNTPAHEPSGGLSAARLYPIVELYYNTPDQKTKIEDYVASFRVDYRLYINLDTYAKKQTIATPGFDGYPGSIVTVYDRSKKSEGKMNNAAGIFRDEDEDAGLLTKAWDGLVRSDPGNFIFSAAEKPLVAEVVTEGLNPDNAVRWDNVHWWGAAKDGILGSTPGSFHAVHIHWRWSKVLRDKDGPAPYSGYPQFKGMGTNGALVDPAFINQVLRFAVVKNYGLPADYHAQKSVVYKDFFTGLRKNGPPLPVEQEGGDLVLYYSVEVKTATVKKNRDGALHGAVFVHGLFFAHDIEKDSMYAGRRDTFYKNPEKPPKTTWERYPKK